MQSLHLDESSFGSALKDIAQKKVAEEWADMIEYLYQECEEAAKRGQYLIETEKNIHPSVLRYMKDVYGLHSHKHEVPDVYSMRVPRARRPIVTTIYW